MATYRVWSGGSNTSPYDTWAKAATTFAAAVTAASSNGDIIYVHYTHQENLAGNTTYTLLADLSIISVNKDSSDAPTVMGTGGWIGHDTDARTITLTGPRTYFIYGITWRFGANYGGTFGSGDGTHLECNGMMIWHSSTSATAGFNIGNVENCFIKSQALKIKVDRTTSGDWLVFSGRNEHTGMILELAGTVATGFLSTNANSSGTANVTFIGCDLSPLGSGATLVQNQTRTPAVYKFINCQMPANAVVMAAQTSVPNLGSAHVFVYDSYNGDTHGQFEYHNAFGSIVSDRGIYYTSSSAAQSWKITTTANCTLETPFVSQPIPRFYAPASAITPYVEILRNTSTTEYTDAEVWLTVDVKVTDAKPISTSYNDKVALLGTPANQAAGAGLGSWTGEAGSAWSGKIGLGSSITPAEVGYIAARVVVGKASVANLYVDPRVLW